MKHSARALFDKVVLIEMIYYLRYKGYCFHNKIEDLDSFLSLNDTVCHWGADENIDLKNIDLDFDTKTKKNVDCCNDSIITVFQTDMSSLSCWQRPTIRTYDHRYQREKC